MSRKYLLLILAFGILLAVPSVIHDTFFLRIVTEAILWIGLAISWDVLAGYTGYLNFGHGAFFGIGAYTTALLMKLCGWSFFFVLPVAGVAAGILALIAGIPTLRLKGAYFAIATWAMALAIQQVAWSWILPGGPTA